MPDTFDIPRSMTVRMPEGSASVARIAERVRPQFERVNESGEAQLFVLKNTEK